LTLLRAEILRRGHAEPMALPLGPAIGNASSAGKRAHLFFRDHPPPAQRDRAMVATPRTQRSDVWLLVAVMVGGRWPSALLPVRRSRCTCAETRTDELDQTASGRGPGILAAPAQKASVKEYCAGSV